MFAPKVSKPQAELIASSASSLAQKRSAFGVHPTSVEAVEQAHSLQRSMGNQAMLRLFAQRTSALTWNQPGGYHEQQGDGDKVTGQETTSAVTADFSKIPIFPPEPARVSNLPSSSSPESIPATIQLKLAVGRVDDPLEDEADSVADQVMRMSEPSSSRLPRQTEQLKAIRSKATGRAEAQSAPLTVDEALRSPTCPLDANTRAFMERQFRYDFSHVRLHAGGFAERSARDLSANAYTVGQHIVFGSGRLAPGTRDGRRLIAHELTHVIQQSGARSAPMIARSPAQPSPPVAWGSGWFPSQGGVIPGKQGPLPPTIFEQPSAWTPVGAPAAFDAFLTLTPDMRKTAVEFSYASGSLGKALAALGASNAQDKYADAVREVGRLAQEYATHKTSGKSDAELAKTHGTWMEAQAVAAAKAATGTTAPSTESVASAGAKIVAGNAIAPAVPPKWDSPGFPKAKWTAAGERTIDVMVRYATASYPSLKLRKDQFVLAFKEMEQVSGAATAYHTRGPGGGSLLHIGYDFVKTVLMTDDVEKMLTTSAKPEYMIEVVVHELLGHHEFEDSSYAMSLYDASAASRPSYTRPAEGTDERRNERDSFGYHSTEIYALMRGFDYKHPVAASDRVPGVLVLSDPKDEIARYVGVVAKEWEPSVGTAVMRGLYVRFRMDPRLSAAAIAALADAIRTHFPSTSTSILK